MSEKINENKIQIYDLIIIGAGRSGLLTCKYAKTYDLSVLVLESRDHIGGIWKYSDKNNIKTIAKNSRTKSSKTFQEFSDYSIPKYYNNFPSHSEIYKYLKNYSNEFNLYENIRFNTWITDAHKIYLKENNLWELTDSTGKKYYSTFLTICAGVSQKKYIPRKIRFFKGKIINCFSYKYLTPNFLNKKIMIYGSHYLAPDIVNDILPYVKNIIWSIPDGIWLNPKLCVTNNKEENYAFDNFSSHLKYKLFHDKTRKGVYLFEDIIEKFNGKNGHGIAAWSKDSPYNHDDMIYNTDFINNVGYKKIIAKRNILQVNKNNVEFDDNSIHKIDTIILCLDDQESFPFLKEKKHTTIDKYKYIFDTEDPTLSFVGYVTPNTGSSFCIAELQAMYVASVYSGKLKLPKIEKMKEVVMRDNEYWKKYFNNNPKRLVDLQLYSNDISNKLNIKPNYTALFFRSPIKWWQAISAPYNNCRYLINNEENEELIFSRYKNYQPKNNIRNSCIYFLYYLAFIFKPIYLFLRDNIANKKTNSLVDLNDKEYIKKKQKKKHIFYLIIVCVIIILIVPEWNYEMNSTFVKFLGPSEKLKNSKLLVSLFAISIYLLYF
jgi:dimethylaniline monooxygenase (N-oxide forming)